MYSRFRKDINPKDNRTNAQNKLIPWVKNKKHHTLTWKSKPLEKENASHVVQFYVPNINKSLNKWKQDMIPHFKKNPSFT